MSHKVSKITTKPLRIAMIHPMFTGIAGADRLIIEACLSLQSKGNTVNIFTTDYHLKQESFSDEGMVNITSINTHMPNSIFGYCVHPFNCLKSMILIVCALSRLLSHDMIICDQLPTGILILYFLMSLLCVKNENRPILAYYCHYPDFAHVFLLKRGFILSAGRRFFSFLEKKAMQCSDIVYANSGFTKTAIITHFPQCHHVEVLYPGIPEFTPNFEISNSFFKENPVCAIIENTNSMLSLNRFLPSKYLERIIALTNALKQKKTKLTTVIMGGGCGMDIEKLEYLSTLVAICKAYSLSFTVAHANKIILCSKDQPTGAVDVLFVVNGTDEQKRFFLAHSKALFYTASYEHFGMGIVEGMLSHCFPIAMASGGPLEIIEHMKSGYLVPEPTNGASFSPPADLVNLLAKLYGNNLAREESPQDLKKIIENGYNRAKSLYTIEAFSDAIIKHYLAKSAISLPE